MVSLREFYRRVHKGPLVTEKEFLGMSFFERLQSLAKEYGITCEAHDHFIPTDESLADDLFKAGKALLEERGLWCMDTSRLVEFTGKEIDESLNKLPTEVTFGEGTERVTVKHRSTGDKRQPGKLIGSWGAGFSSPTIFLKANQSVAQEDIDILQDGVITMIGGERVRIGTPEEYYAAAMGSRLMREAVRRAGKPGLPINFDCQAMTEYAHSGILVPGGARPTDMWTLWPSYPHATIRMVSLNRAALSLEYSNPLFTYATGSLYGYAGGAATSAIALVADAIGLAMLDNVWALITGGASLVVRGAEGSKERWVGRRESTWTTRIAHLALFRNIKGIVGSGGGGGPAGSDLGFYGSAVSRISCEPCTALLDGIFGGSGGGSEAERRRTRIGGVSGDYMNGLSARWVIEMGNEVAGISLSDANDMIKTLVECPKYKPYATFPPKYGPLGKPFIEIYDIETVQPRKKYLEQYDRVTREIKDLLGINYK